MGGAYLLASGREDTQQMLRQRETFDGRRRIHDRGEAMRAEHKALHQLVVARERP